MARSEIDHSPPCSAEVSSEWGSSRTVMVCTGTVCDSSACCSVCGSSACCSVCDSSACCSVCDSSACCSVCVAAVRVTAVRVAVCV
jgi:hypothetical protein